MQTRSQSNTRTVLATSLYATCRGKEANMSGVLGVLFLFLAAAAALKTVLDEKEDQKYAAEPVEFMNIPSALEDISKDDTDELYSQRADINGKKAKGIREHLRCFGENYRFYLPCRKLSLKSTENIYRMNFPGEGGGGNLLQWPAREAPPRV